MRVLGAYGNQLLDWLQNWIFPEEVKYGDRAYARPAAKHFFDALLAGGTTTCLSFTTSSPVSTEEFFDEAARRNLRVIAGLTGMGYKLVEQRPWGAVELIEIANGRLYGASDPRRPAGAAVGY